MTVRHQSVRQQDDIVSSPESDASGSSASDRSERKRGSSLQPRNLMGELNTAASTERESDAESRTNRHRDDMLQLYHL